MTFDEIKSITSLQTLAWTFPLVLCCALVLIECWRSIVNCIKHRGKLDSSMCWMLYGMAFSFSGKIVESIWWSIPWTLDYLNHPIWKKMNSFGPFINLPFRQFAFTAAAYCCLRAFLAPEKGGSLKYLNIIFITGLFFGELFILLLWMVKNGTFR